VGRSPAHDTPRARGAPALTAFVDTNVLIRHLTGDPPEMARRASEFLASGERLLLTDHVLAECVLVLESFYEVERAQVAALTRAAVALPAIATVDPASLLRALEVYEVDRLDFAEGVPRRPGRGDRRERDRLVRPDHRPDRQRRTARTLAPTPPIAVAFRSVLDSLVEG
jgi:predicted nucleic acid-binding protein